MNKLFTKIAALCLGATMAVGVGVAVGSSGKEATPVHAATQSLTFNLTKNPGGWPTTASSTETTYSYTLNQVAYEFSLKNVKQNSGYLMMNYTAALGLPKLSNGKLTKVVAKNSSGCSTSTKVGISSSASSASYISGGAIQTYSTTSSTYTYNLSGTSNNTRYYIYVTNKNCQLTSIELTYEVAETFTISYNANGGSSTMSSTTGTNPAVASCTFTAPTGKHFDHWNTSATDNGTTYAVGDKPGATITLYAIWATNSYTVSGTITNGQLSSTANVEYGSSLNIKINPSTNYTYPETLTSVTMGGSTLTAGSGYTYDNSTGAISIASVTGNVVINATCVPLGTAYTVTYNANGGSVSTTSEEIIENGNPSFPVPTKNGFQFKGWQINGSGTAYTNPNDYLVTQDVEFVALWEAITMESLTVNYTGGKPYLGEKFTFAGTIEANMSDGSQESVAISDVDFEVDPYIITQQTVTATHKTTGVTGTFNVQYQAKSYTTTTTEQKTLIVRASDVGGTNNSYALKDWTVGGVSGKSYTYASTSSASAFQFNGSKGTNIFYNTSAIPGKIKSVKMTKSSGTDRGGVEVFVHTSAMTSSNYTSGTNLGSKTVTSAGVTWSVPTTNTNNNVYLYVHYPTGNALYVSQVEITYEKTTTVTSSEKHAIRIADVTCSKSPLIAGETISNSDFKIQVQYDTGTALTSNIVPTSVSPTTLVAGTHDYTITYTGSYNDTVTKVIQLTAQAPAVLDSISITKDVGCDDVFTRNDTFTHNGIHVIAHYTDSTTYPDADVTADADIPAPSNMNVAGTKTINVSYEENGVTKTTSYQITVNPIVSTYLTLSGEGIEGSNGVYTLKSGVENEVQLTINKDGDEEIDFVNPTTFLSFDKTSSKLTVNSQTTTNESGTITFTVGSLTASLTVNVSAAEGIQNLGDEEIDTYVGSSFTHNINIKLNNVESAEWTLPQGNFVITTTTKDETGLVGTIYFTDEVLDTLTFSVLTGKGATLTVDIDVLAVNDEIKSISASLKTGVSYTAGQGQTFSKDDLTVTYVRDSGANGTLLSSEFTVSGLPEGSFNRVASYQLTITSVENTEATDSVTINVGMPKDKLGNDLNIVTKTSVHHEGTSSTSWNLLTNKSQLDANEKIYLYESSKGYVTGVSGSDATVSQTASDRLEFVIDIVNSTDGTFKLKRSSDNKYISNLADNKFNIAASQSEGAVFQISGDGVIYYTDSKAATRALAVNGSYLRCYKTGNSGYSYFSAYISKHTSSEPWDEDTYTNNAMTATLYNFIAKANEVYANVCGSEGNNLKPDLTTWLSVLDSDEYEALVADTNSYNLLKSAICGEGAYGPDGVYVASGDKQSSDMVIEFLQKYDRVVSNYPTETDYNYLGRSVTSSGSRINLFLALNKVDSSVWVISAVALVGLTAIGGYFFLRKRKEN